MSTSAQQAGMVKIKDMPREDLENTVQRLAGLHLTYIVLQDMDNQEALNERVDCGCPRCQYDLQVLIALGIAEVQGGKVTKH